MDDIPIVKKIYIGMYNNIDFIFYIGVDILVTTVFPNEVVHN